MGGFFKNPTKAIAAVGDKVSNSQTLNRPQNIVTKLVGGSFDIAGSALGGAGGLLGQTTQIVGENPELAGIGGAAFGVPGLGGLFGSQEPAGGGGGGGLFTPQSPSKISGQAAQSGGNNTILYIAIGGAVLVAIGAVIYFARK